MVDGTERGLMWYNKVECVGFRITIEVSYLMRVVEYCHSMEWMKQLISN